jgi:uncharacterized protein
MSSHAKPAGRWLEKENPMQFLYCLTPVRSERGTVGPAPEEQASVSERFAHLEMLTSRGVMLLVGRTRDNSPRTFGIAIFEAESEAQAQAIMNGVPAVREGVMHAELFPFRIALAGEVSAHV